MIEIEGLRSEYEEAEKELFALGSEYDDAKRELRERYELALAKATARAAETQKAVCNAEALVALSDRDDASNIALSLVRQGGITRKQVAAAGIEISK